MRSLFGYIGLLGTTAAAASSPPVTLTVGADVATIDNGFVSAGFSIFGNPWLSSLKGDFQGKGNYGDNLLSAMGLRLERF